MIDPVLGTPKIFNVPLLAEGFVVSLCIFGLLFGL